MILSGENRNTGRETCDSGTFSTTKLTQTDLGRRRPREIREWRLTALTVVLQQNNI